MWKKLDVFTVTDDDSVVTAESSAVLKPADLLAELSPSHQLFVAPVDEL